MKNFYRVLVYVINNYIRITSVRHKFLILEPQFRCCTDSHQNLIFLAVSQNKCVSFLWTFIDICKCSTDIPFSTPRFLSVVSQNGYSYLVPLPALRMRKSEREREREREHSSAESARKTNGPIVSGDLPPYVFATDNSCAFRAIPIVRCFTFNRRV